MNDAVIIAVANAITSNAEVLKSLIDALPKATKDAVEKKVIKATPAPAPVATVETPAPVVVETVTVPVVVPATPAAPVMPAAPFPTVAATAVPPVAPQPVASPAPIPASMPAGAPFADHQGMMKYVMDSYQSMPKDKGMLIQNVLVSLGAQNINNVTPEQYGALYAGVEKLKVS